MDRSFIFGHNPEPFLVAAEVADGPADGPNASLYFRRNRETIRVTEPFRPFVLLESEALLAKCPEKAEIIPLQGTLRFKRLALFESWRELVRAKTWLSKKTGFTPGNPAAPYLLIQDPVYQFLMATGRTMFKEMEFEELRRMQVDIETFTAPGFEFCNADRESDRILMIALGDQTGWTEVLHEPSSEKKLLERFVQAVQDRDPDVIEGHNIFKFDLPYIAARAARHGVRLALGRDGSAMTEHPSRFTVGERTVSYPKFEIHGRHVVDTMFLLYFYDVSTRALDGFGLKDAALHFGFARNNRVHIEGSEIAATYLRDPDRVVRYAADDIAETRALSDALSRTYFAQAQMLPFGYQNVCLRGNAVKIDALMMREYFRRRHSVPSPGEPREFAGGYTDIFERGVIANVHHCDVRSLYPSLMLANRIGPASDPLGVFLKMLEFLTEFRKTAKDKACQAAAGSDRLRLDSIQAAFKILINSFYGYLGAAQALFNDFDAAERVTAEGRSLIRAMLAKLRELGAKPVELDTDGIYFVPPSFKSKSDLDRFRRNFTASLPAGIEVEFDGEYRAMFSYKMKNYALLEHDGSIVVKGAALKSRGLEPFLRRLVRDYLRLKLEGRQDKIAELAAGRERELREGRIPIALLAKTETLKDSPATYSEKLARTGRGRNAAYELALASGRDYQAGDQISYYITGTRKNVAAHSAAKLLSQWNPAQRDENVEYYAAKIRALIERLESGADDDDNSATAAE